MVRTKQAVLQNNGFEELSLTQIYDIVGLTPNFSLVKHNKLEYIPRRLPNNFIPKINYYNRRTDGLLTTVCLKKGIQKYYFSPSMTLFATLQRKNKDEIYRMLGGKDNLDLIERVKLIEIMNYLQKGSILGKLREEIKYFPKDVKKRVYGNMRKYVHIEKKGLDHILEPEIVEGVLFNGHAFNAKVMSKRGSIKYNISQKQLITFENNNIIIPDSIQTSCSCGFNQASNLKYEFDVIFPKCHHIELLRQTLANPSLGSNIRLKNKYGNNPIKAINNIFTPFNLDYPELGSKRLRTILRDGLYAFIVPQKFIEQNFDDSHNVHKNNGFTLFRAELDAFLLGFKEIYNPDFFNLWMSNIDEERSVEYTCKFFGDYREVGVERVFDVEHNLNSVTKNLEHLINNNWFKIEHGVINSETNEFIALLNNDQFIHDIDNGFEHKFSNSQNNDLFKIVHYKRVYEPFIDFSTPFKVGKLDNDIEIFIAPYKMRDTKY